MSATVSAGTVVGDQSAAYPVAAGSISAIHLGVTRERPGTPLARARRWSASSAGSSSGVGAMTSLPHRRAVCRAGRSSRRGHQRRGSKGWL